MGEEGDVLSEHGGHPGAGVEQAAGGGPSTYQVLPLTSMWF